jgi:hypothetical protein
MLDLSISPQSEDCCHVISAGHGLQADVDCASPPPCIVVVRKMTKSLTAPVHDAEEIITDCGSVSLPELRLQCNELNSSSSCSSLSTHT